MDSAMWDARYEASDLVWSAEPNLFLPPLVDGMEPGRALDLACGEGRNALWLASRDWSVTGVDFSPVAIRKARELSPEANVDWVVGDATTYEADRFFDLVLVFYLQLPADSIARAFERAVASLAPGGTLICVGHAVRNVTDGYGGPPYPEILWSQELIAPLVSDLDVLELGERGRYVADADATAIDLVVLATKPI